MGWYYHRYWKVQHERRGSAWTVISSSLMSVISPALADHTYAGRWIILLLLLIMWSIFLYFCSGTGTTTSSCKKSFISLRPCLDDQPKICVRCVSVWMLWLLKSTTWHTTTTMSNPEWQGWLRASSAAYVVTDAYVSTDADPIWSN